MAEQRSIAARNASSLPQAGPVRADETLLLGVSGAAAQMLAGVGIA